MTRTCEPATLCYGDATLSTAARRFKPWAAAFPVRDAGGGLNAGHPATAGAVEQVQVFGHQAEWETLAGRGVARRAHHHLLGRGVGQAPMDERFRAERFDQVHAQGQRLAVRPGRLGRVGGGSCVPARDLAVKGASGGT